MSILLLECISITLMTTYIRHHIQNGLKLCPTGFTDESSLLKHMCRLLATNFEAIVCMECDSCLHPPQHVYIQAASCSAVPEHFLVDQCIQQTSGDPEDKVSRRKVRSLQSPWAIRIICSNYFISVMRRLEFAMCCANTELQSLHRVRSFSEAISSYLMLFDQLFMQQESCCCQHCSRCLLLNIISDCSPMKQLYRL
jgi:hypothetical protein